MMMNRLLLFPILFSSLLSCQINKSEKIDLVTGLVTKGNGVSCENVYLSNGGIKINRNFFVYGEKFYLNFDNIVGFKKIKDKVYPGMELLITNKKSDTIMHNPDLYRNSNNGIDISPLLLQANITAANPIHSSGDYTLVINIWDKKGKGIFTAEMDFEVQANENIVINNTNISYDEIYLFSSKTGTAIVDNNARFDENIHFVFEGLKGFYEEDGKSFIGLSMLATDFEGNIIVEEKDLLIDSTIDNSVLKEKVAPNFSFPTSNVKNTVNCEILIWDKKSDHKIHARATLNIK